MAKRTAMFWTAAVLSVALLGCGVVWQISRAIAAGAPDGVANQTLSELQEKLRKAATIQERNEVIDAFRRLPGPDAQAAQILLDYLREKARTDAWGVTDALIKLMSEEQVARLAQDLRTYDEVNATAYLVPVLAARVNNVPTLSGVMLSLQAFPGYYDPFVALAWEKIFADAAQVVNWLDDLYARLADPMLRENLFEAVSRYTGEKLAGPRRAAAVAWLWRVQQQEENTSVRCRELLTLYKLGEAKALAALHEVYAGVTEARERAGIVYQAGSAARWELKGATREELIGWLWQVARTEGAPFVRQSCLYTLYELGEEKALAALVQDIDRNGVAWLPDEHDRGVGPTIWWQWLKEVRDRYPQSYLARGIEAYERVRGQPYFAIEREEQEPGAWPPRFYGDDQYDPAREIPGWEKFLAAFSRHPAADDAAYRLARCYEIQGRWADALNALHQAFFLPDG
ncbi:MAG: putative membrane protein, partial [Clostridia bacterium 62_21]